MLYHARAQTRGGALYAFDGSLLAATASARISDGRFLLLDTIADPIPECLAESSTSEVGSVPCQTPGAMYTRVPGMIEMVTFKK